MNYSVFRFCTFFVDLFMNKKSISSNFDEEYIEQKFKYIFIQTSNDLFIIFVHFQ